MNPSKNFKLDLQQQRDDGAENFRERQSEKLVRFLRLTFLEIFGQRKVEDVLKDEVSIRKLVTDISTEEYIAILSAINSVLRNKAKEDFGALDGEGVMMGHLDIFPKQEDKPELLAKSLAGAKEMITQKRTTEDVAILLSSVLTAIHPFVDGNGRTAKTILILLMKGFNESILGRVLSDTNQYSNLVNSSSLASMANGVLEDTFSPSEEFKNFEAYYESREYKRRQVETMIDIIVNENDYIVVAQDNHEVFTRYAVYKASLEEFGKFSNFKSQNT